MKKARAMESSPGGFTLAELLVCILFFSIFALAIFQFSRTMLFGVRTLESAVDAQDAARLAVQMIERDVRGAGFSASGGAVSAVRQAGSAALQVASDLNGDGDTNDANELIGYGFSAATRTLTRTMGNAPPQPMLSGLAGNGLRFDYLDAGLNPIAPGGALDAAERAQIRRIDVRVAIELRNPDPTAPHSVAVVQRTSVCLRNRGCS